MVVDFSIEAKIKNWLQEAYIGFLKGKAIDPKIIFAKFTESDSAELELVFVKSIFELYERHDYEKYEIDTDGKTGLYNTGTQYDNYVPSRDVLESSYFYEGKGYIEVSFIAHVARILPLKDAMVRLVQHYAETFQENKISKLMWYLKPLEKLIAECSSNPDFRGYYSLEEADKVFNQFYGGPY